MDDTIEAAIIQFRQILKPGKENMRLEISEERAACLTKIEDFMREVELAADVGEGRNRRLDLGGHV